MRPPTPESQSPSPCSTSVSGCQPNASKAGGASVPLRAGMLLTADILGHRRTLFESLFDPEAVTP